MLKDLLSLNNDYIESSRNLKNDSPSFNELRQNYVSKIKELNKSLLKNKNHDEMKKNRNLGIIFSIIPAFIYFHIS